MRMGSAPIQLELWGLPIRVSETGILKSWFSTITYNDKGFPRDGCSQIADVKTLRSRLPYVRIQGQFVLDHRAHYAG